MHFHLKWSKLGNPNVLFLGFHEIILQQSQQGVVFATVNILRVPHYAIGKYNTSAFQPQVCRSSLLSRPLRANRYSLPSHLVHNRSNMTKENPIVEPEYSSLQPLSNDQPANAPEVDTAATTHRFNNSQVAELQVMPHMSKKPPFLGIYHCN